MKKNLNFQMTIGKVPLSHKLSRKKEKLLKFLKVSERKLLKLLNFALILNFSNFVVKLIRNEKK